jgi:acyl carrier protein
MQPELSDVRGILAAVLGSARVDGVADDDLIVQTGVIDSLMLVEVIDTLEAQLGIRVEGEELVPENFESLAAMAAYVAKKRRA